MKKFLVVILILIVAAGVISCAEEEFWKTGNSDTFPTTEQKPEETDSVEKDCGGLHRYGDETVIINEGSCTEERTIGQRCINCGYANNTTALGKVHSFGDYVVTVAQTCTTSGKQVAECTLCGATDEKYIPAEHEDYFNEIEPTCTTDGKKIKFCKNCSLRVVVEEYLPLGHDFKLIWNGDWKCMRCNTMHEQLYKSHKVTKIIVRRSTCAEKGIVHSICETCGLDDETETTIWPHSYVYETFLEPTCTNVGQIKGVCQACGDTVYSDIDKISHSYVYETVLEPTCTSVGQSKGVCQACEDAVYSDIDKISHNLEYITDNDKMYKCTCCGLELKVSGFDFEEISSFLLTYDGDILIKNYTNGHWSKYISTKTIKNETDDAVKKIAAYLAELKPTGEVAEKLADEPIDWENTNGLDLPIEFNTWWIEVGDLIYRVNKQRDQICIVDTHLGSGLVLEHDEELMKYLISVYNHWPNNGSLITYDKDNLKLDDDRCFIPDNSYFGDSKVDIYLWDGSFNFDVPKYEYYEVKFKVVAREDVNEQVVVHSYQSEDNIGSYKVYDVKLKKGQAAYVSGKFSGWSSGGFWLEIEMSNTVVTVYFEWFGI